MLMSAGLGPLPGAQALGVSATPWAHREGERSFREAATRPGTTLTPAPRDSSKPLGGEVAGKVGSRDVSRLSST